LNENHTMIIINIKDVNDLPPVFPEAHYEKTMDEETEAPYKMIQVEPIRYFPWLRASMVKGGKK
jgi:hypothetical protein